jgi:SAM-dependent methyltransferase
VERREIQVRTPDAEELHRALDDAAATEGGALVRLPVGRIELSHTLLVPDGTTLLGAGPTKTILALAPGASTHLITNRAERGARIGLHRLGLDGTAEHQAKPDGARMVWGCGAVFRHVRGIVVDDVRAVDIAQTALHFQGCADVRIEGLRCDRMGWSGFSTSGTDDLIARDVVIRRAGYAETHSGIHLDGGRGAFLEATVEDTSGNAIMLDSNFAELSHVVVRGVGRRSYRGLALSGSHTKRLHHVTVSGEYDHNEKAGVMVSNADHVFVVGVRARGNGEHGVLLQGRNGARDCVVADCDLADNPLPVAERHASADNRIWFIDRHEAGADATGARSARAVASRGARSARVQVYAVARRLPKPAKHAARGTAKRLRRLGIPVPGVTLAPAPRPSGPATGALRPDARPTPASRPTQAARPTPAAPDPDEVAYEGRCRVCGEAGRFTFPGGSPREHFRCPTCRANLRYQGQADVLCRRYGDPEAASIAELVRQDRFRSLDIFEPGLIGPIRPYLLDLPSYAYAGYWPDVAPGDERDGVRCEDLMGLTFPDESFDLVITSDIFEHVRHPEQGFAEVRRVLRPGGAHVFTIPVLAPMPKRTKVRVDTSGPEDVHLVEPNYHLGPNDSRHLVYQDFGADLIDQLGELGLATEAIGFDAPVAPAARLVTFVSVRVG